MSHHWLQQVQWKQSQGSGIQPDGKQEWTWRVGLGERKQPQKGGINQERSVGKSGRRQRTIQCVRQEAGPVTGARDEGVRAP